MGNSRWFRALCRTSSCSWRVSPTTMACKRQSWASIHSAKAVAAWAANCWGSISSESSTQQPRSIPSQYAAMSSLSILISCNSPRSVKTATADPCAVASSLTDSYNSGAIRLSTMSILFTYASFLLRGAFLGCVPRMNIL